MTQSSKANTNSLDLEVQDDFLDEDFIEDEIVPQEALADLALYTLDWSVESLLERIGTTIDIEPPFQRRDAWTFDRKSRYIESLMLGLPVPQIVLAESKDQKGQFVVLDGKQRLLTIKQFASPDEKFKSFKLKKMEFLTELNGLTLDNLEKNPRGKEFAEIFRLQPIRTIVVRNWKDPAVLYRIFVRLNQGSLILSPQELRQALFPGPFTEWINGRSARSIPIQMARRISSPDFRMRDANMLLRFVAFSDSIEEYRGNLRKFLDDACVIGATNWHSKGPDYYESKAILCESAIERVFKAFSGEEAFFRYSSEGYNGNFNLAVFDLMTSVLGDESISDEEYEALAPQIRPLFESLCIENRDFSDSLTSTTQSVKAMGGRVMIFGKAVAKLLNHNLSVLKRASKMLEQR